MSTLTDCPNCGAKIKTGAFSSNVLIEEKPTRLINEYANEKKEGYCQKCIGNKYDLANKQLIEDWNNANEALQLAINDIPVITTHSPLNWEYEILGLATGQTTTGTGVISEFTSSFSDLFGGQAHRYNAKLKAGEKLCLDQLRTQTIEMGGNAVIATDIDYSEIGGGKGMIMVCMAGTVIRLNNLEVIGERSKHLNSLYDLFYRTKYLYDLKTSYSD